MFFSNLAVLANCIFAKLTPLALKGCWRHFPAIVIHGRGAVAN